MSEDKWRFSEEWILERYKCFGKFDDSNRECTMYCKKQIGERCKEKSEENKS